MYKINNYALYVLIYTAGLLSLRADILISGDDMDIREEAVSSLYILQGSHDGKDWQALDVEGLEPINTPVNGFAIQACRDAGYAHCRIIEIADEEWLERVAFSRNFKLLSRGQAFNLGIMAEKIAGASEAITGLPVHLPAALVGNALNTVSVYAALIEEVERGSPEYVNGLKGDAGMLAAWLSVFIADTLSMAADYSKTYATTDEGKEALVAASTAAGWAAMLLELPLATWDLKGKVVRIWELKQNEYPTVEAQDQAWQAVYAYSFKLGSSVLGFAVNLAMVQGRIDGDNFAARWSPRLLSFIGAWWFLASNLGDPEAA